MLFNHLSHFCPHHLPAFMCSSLSSCSPRLFECPVSSSTNLSKSETAFKKHKFKFHLGNKILCWDRTQDPAYARQTLPLSLQAHRNLSPLYPPCNLYHTVCHKTISPVSSRWLLAPQFGYKLPEDKSQQVGLFTSYHSGEHIVRAED